MYAKGGLTFVDKHGKDYTYEAVLESILAEAPEKPMYVVLLSGGNDVYGPRPEPLYEEEYEDVQVGMAMAKLAARLWYQRIPGLFVFGATAHCFQYTGLKASVFDRRVVSVRGLAQRILSACKLPYQVVSGVPQLQPLRGYVVDGIGHYAGTEDAYYLFARALADFCARAPATPGAARRSRL